MSRMTSISASGPLVLMFLGGLPTSESPENDQRVRLWTTWFQRINRRTIVVQHTKDLPADIANTVCEKNFLGNENISLITCAGEDWYETVWGTASIVAATISMMNVATVHADVSPRKFILLDKTSIPIVPFDYLYAVVTLGHHNWLEPRQAWILPPEDYPRQQGDHYVRKTHQWMIIDGVYAPYFRIDTTNKITLQCEDRLQPGSVKNTSTLVGRWPDYYQCKELDEFYFYDTITRITGIDIRLFTYPKEMYNGLSEEERRRMDAVFQQQCEKHRAVFWTLEHQNILTSLMERSSLRRITHHHPPDYLEVDDAAEKVGLVMKPSAERWDANTLLGSAWDRMIRQKLKDQRSKQPRQHTKKDLPKAPLTKEEQNAIKQAQDAKYEQDALIHLSAVHPYCMQVLKGSIFTDWFTMPLDGRKHPYAHPRVYFIKSVEAFIQDEQRMIEMTKPDHLTHWSDPKHIVNRLFDGYERIRGFLLRVPEGMFRSIGVSVTSDLLYDAQMKGYFFLRKTESIFTTNEPAIYKQVFESGLSSIHIHTEDILQEILSVAPGTLSAGIIFPEMLKEGSQEESQEAVKSVLKGILGYLQSGGSFHDSDTRSAILRDMAYAQSEIQKIG